mmetsp:Transcript_21557/g.85724  ORF Transcript_21557/g.85724 Transcript_21557/m.85724 type:complete len:212 (+) Transcript_21557:770-1405(+)
MKVCVMSSWSRSWSSFMKVELWRCWSAHMPPDTSVDGTNMLPQCDDESETKAWSLGRYGLKTGAASAARMIIDPAEWPTKLMRPTRGSGSARSAHRCLMKLCTSCARRCPIGPIDPPVLSSFDCGDSTTARGNSSSVNARSSRMSNDDAYQPCCITMRCGPRLRPPGPASLEDEPASTSSSKLGTPGAAGNAVGGGRRGLGVLLDPRPGGP